MANFVKQIIENDKRELKRLDNLANKVESRADEMAQLTNEELQAKTPEFKERIKNGESLDKLLPEAFAVVREAAKRVLGLYPYHVQIMGGIVLHDGNIPEMKTGEGKTLTATMPVYLNALSGKGVHVVTVNEYLTQRDAESMGELYEFLGLTVGVNINSKSSAEKREAYNCDITYSTNNELGFDYLRDNMVVYKEDMVQRPLNYAIVDEVDSILIDEARTPLIISGPAEKSTTLYIRADKFVKTLKEEVDYIIDVQTKTIALTDEGIDKAEKVFHLEELYDADNTALTHHIDEALRANYIMIRDKDYVVREGKVLIVDQFTGRIMDGRRYSDGLHQAIEAKEGVDIEDETKTMANITFQNYFRMYNKLAGMTGTAKTEEEEFREIYNMQVVQIPTNKPIARDDRTDLIYGNLHDKFQAVIEDIKERHAKGQPVLVGTVAIETSELLSDLLNNERIPHEVLNAKNHYKEAEIIMNAGQPGAVTIATNMAGRGTDIKLGPGVAELGGLAVIGTERHESRRIDNQLRGRSGRQGDPGVSQFYLSLEDELMRRFGADRVRQLMEKMNQDGIALESKILTKQVEAAQKRVEGNNYDSRKQVLQYDDVMREQRERIYNDRFEIITAQEDLEPVLMNMVRDTVTSTVKEHTMGNKKEWNLKAIANFSDTVIAKEGEVTEDMLSSMSPKEMIQLLMDKAQSEYNRKAEAIGNKNELLEFQKVVILRVVDEQWTDHIDSMDQLRESINLRAYGQNNPVVEYQQEGTQMYNQMLSNIAYEVTRLFMKSQIHHNVEREHTA